MYICRIGGFGLLSYIVKSTVRVTGKEAINVLHDQLWFKRTTLPKRSYLNLLYFY